MSDSNFWTRGLNQQQVEAVLHNSGPLLILAGAGSGKTTVLVSRTGRLIDEGIVSPKKMCVLTFTNKAARELKQRVAAKLGARAKGVWAGTFHSFGLQLLRTFHKKAALPKEFGVMDPTDGSAIIKELLKNFHNAEKTAYDPDRVLNLLSDWRSKGVKSGNQSDEYEMAAEWVMPKYLKRLEHLGMIDFDGLILRPLQLMQEDKEVAERIQSHYEYIMVDEFQDTNETQMQLVAALSEPMKNLAVVGDDDQSIYGWRGACVRNILDFPKRYPTSVVVRLEQNYRSAPAILDVANTVISKNTQRHKKTLRAANRADEGEKPEVFVYENENMEAEGVTGEISSLIAKGHARKDIAVLYRSNSQGALVEAELRRLNIPYEMSGGTAFFDRREIRDVLAYLRCGIRPNEVAFRRILNTPTRGIGEKAIETLTEFSAQHHLAFHECARRWREAGVDPKAGAAIEELFEFLQQLTPLTGAQLLEKLGSIGYKAHLNKLAPDSLVAQKRWRFIELFAGILDKYVENGQSKAEALKDFLDSMELRDIPDDEKKDKVQLMTLHACKGLEFPIVFLMGIEEDLIPHKTLGSDVSEERRLFYVGITRAQNRLILSRAQKRKRHGKWVDCAPSRFLLDIPETLITSFTGGRPLQPGARKSMLDDLFKKLDSLDKERTPAT